MSLTVVAGLPGSGTGAYLHDVAVRASLEGREAVLAVPRDTDALRARAIMSVRVPVGVRVATFDGIIESEWALRGDGRRLIRGLARDVLLARALEASGVDERPGRGLIALLGTLSERARGPVPSAGAGLPGDLVRSVGAYRALVTAHGMIERSDACRILQSCPPPGDVIAVDGFRILHPDHEELLAAWSGAGAEVVVSVAWLPDTAGTEAAEPTIRRFEDAGAQVVLLEETGNARPEELRRARNGLFAGPPAAPGSGAVSLGVAEGREAEARFIARTASAIIASGVDPAHVVITFAEPSRHEAWLRRAFDDAGVPAEFLGTAAVGETPIGAALFGLRSCATADLTRADLSALMRSPFAGVTAERADAADLAWRRTGLTRGRGLLGRADALTSLVEDARALNDRPIGVLTAKKWKNLADRLLANAYPGASPVPAEDGGLDAAVHRAFCRHLREALELGDGEVGVDEFWERFADARVSAHASRAGGRVVVDSIDEVPLEGASHVIIGGLTASECPRRASEDRLEGDAVSRALTMLGVPLDPEMHMRQERYAFYLAVAAASETLTLTRCGTDDEGAPQRESLFWDELLDLYRAPGDTPDPACLPHLERVGADMAVIPGTHRAARGVLSERSVREDLGSIIEVSPSEVETYLSCPYRWFVDRRLRAASPDVDMDPAAVGRIAHDTLARFYRARLDAGAGRVTPTSRDTAMAEAERLVTEARVAAGTPGSLEGIMLLQTVVPSVTALVARDADFMPGYAPTEVEWSFGGNSDVPAIDLGGVSLKGRADRIDAGPEGLIVVDYKRTSASSLKEIRDKRLVQLQLYAVAASRTFGLPVAGGLYRGLRDGNDRGFIRDDVTGSDAFFGNDLIGAGDLTALLDEAAAAAVGAADDMRAGRIGPTPSVSGCRYCGAATFCPEAVTG